MDLELAGHVAVVTGGASGIGRACAEKFAREGACVAVWDMRPDVTAIADEIAAVTDSMVQGCVVDVAQPETIAAALDATRETLGRVDHLVHAAAIGSGKFGFPFLNLTASDWPRVLEVNIMGMTHVAHAIAPDMIAQRSGSMVFVASVAGMIGSPTDPPYSASKAANINFAQCMAKDLASANVRVNTVCPGMVKTPLNRAVWQAWYDQQANGDALSYEAWAEEKVQQVVPLGRWQQPEDVADMIVFLASARAAQVTGQTVNVDGGYVMHW